MLSNLLVFLLLIGLAVLFGWLTYRAIRAPKLWVKILGGLGAGLLTLFFLGVAFMGGKGMAMVYFPDAPAAPELTVASSPELVARGEYLVNMSCVHCHSAVDSAGNPNGETIPSGGWNIAAAEGFGFIGAMVAENLTPGGKLASYSDGELFRVFRYSINEEGQRLGFMDFLPYKELSDDDTHAIIAYLRTLPAVPSSGDYGDKINYIGMVMYGAGMFGTPAAPAPASISAPPQGVTVEYGKYVATFGECRGCHGPDMTGTPASAVSPAFPNPRPFTSTLSQEQFVEMMRMGVRPGGAAFPESMPWQNAAKMTDDDLAALYLYMTAAP